MKHIIKGSNGSLLCLICFSGDCSHVKKYRQELPHQEFKRLITCPACGSQQTATTEDGMTCLACGEVSR